MIKNTTELVARAPEQLGHAISRLRLARGMTQAELGRKAGLRQSTISDLESGKGRIRTLTDALTALDLELTVRPRADADMFDIEDMV